MSKKRVGDTAYVVTFATIRPRPDVSETTAKVWRAYTSLEPAVAEARRLWTADLQMEYGDPVEIDRRADVGVPSTLYVLYSAKPADAEEECTGREQQIWVERVHVD
ncbi:hypothetical protein LTR85_008734 [Meristemomyces frigidus]|nr:hypothetical protein LTR85_008734 [Meristemomyces frigidus]